MQDNFDVKIFCDGECIVHVDVTPTKDEIVLQHIKIDKENRKVRITYAEKEQA